MATCLQIRPGVMLANLTDTGCVREGNEDYYGYWEPETDEEFRRKGRLAIVADGMGGHNGGQEASHLAVDTVRQVYQQSDDDDRQHVLLNAMHAAHERIRQFALEHGLQGMGTTCIAISLSNGYLHYVHVGDSRLYLIRDGVITRMTRDHSYVARLVETGMLSPDDAEKHPDRNVLMAALGADGPLEIECPETPLLLADGDLFLLCTDGLWNLVNDRDLLSVVSGSSPSAACQRLVEMARERGAPDNITLQILKVGNNRNHSHP